jgi:hypothetical protein
LAVLLAAAWLLMLAGLWRLAGRVDQMDRLTARLDEQMIFPEVPRRG